MLPTEMLETELKKIAAAVKDKPDAPQFKFGYAEHKGMTLHSVTFPIKSNDRTVQKLFGDSLGAERRYREQGIRVVDRSRW